MNALQQWARRWGVSPEAVADLATALSIEGVIAGASAEADVMGRVRLSASQAGYRLFRNNVGACHTQDGRFIR